jgi:hypothetical protein
MIFTLIALLLLLVGAAALIRTIDSSSILVGNLAFRRDVTNRAEAAIATARLALVSGALVDEAAREADNASAHYYATRQSDGAGGVPALLLDKSAYATAFSAPTASSDGITLMWVIDRQCLAAGAYSTGTCETVANSTADVGGAGNGIPVAGSRRPVYRISVRVTGPHDVEGFYQATYAD